MDTPVVHVNKFSARCAAKLYLRELSCDRSIGCVVLGDEAEDVHDSVGELLRVVRGGRQLPVLRQGLQLEQR